MVQALRCRDQGFGVDLLVPISLYLIPNVQGPVCLQHATGTGGPLFLKGLLMIGVGVVNEGAGCSGSDAFIVGKHLELCKSLGYIQTLCFKRPRNCVGNDDTLF